MNKFLIAGVMATVMGTTAYADNIRVTVPVLDSQPNYITKTVQQPSQKCNIIEVPIYGNTGKAQTGEVLGGAIIGGILGNQINKLLAVAVLTMPVASAAAFVRCAFTFTTSARRFRPMPLHIPACGLEWWSAACWPTAKERTAEAQSETTHTAHPSAPRFVTMRIEKC